MTCFALKVRLLYMFPLSDDKIDIQREIMLMQETFGKLIARKREQKDLSQRELAKIVGFSNSTIARLERDDITVPSADLLRALAGALDLDYNYLLARTGQIDDEPEIRIIQRAAQNMSQADKERMISILRLAFTDAFESIAGDEGN